MAAEWLEDRIGRGALQPGERIPPEPELCSLIGVGRSSVREAVQALVAAGLLEIRPGTGTYVRAAVPSEAPVGDEVLRRLAPSGVLDLLELRAILERAIVDLAAKRATAEDLAAVAQALAGGAAAALDPIAFADCSAEFHLRLAAATHNAALVEMTVVLNDLLRHRRVSMAAAVTADSNRQAIRKHVEILDAIRARRTREAQEALQTLAEDVRRTVVQEAHAIIRAARERTNTDGT
jgi:GntR family transcriptional repressor for pyruvate dehydrogenase complex